ncbi:hypothetical protein Tco_1139297, partial [Tanacetum coccineum]
MLNLNMRAESNSKSLIGVSPEKHSDAVKLIVLPENTAATTLYVIVDGAYALHARLRSLLDIHVAMVGGVHFSLLSNLHYAHIRINNSFGASFRDSLYKLKCKSE